MLSHSVGDGVDHALLDDVRFDTGALEVDECPREQSLSLSLLNFVLLDAARKVLDRTVEQLLHHRVLEKSIELIKFY